MNKPVVSEAEITVADLVDLALAGEPVTILRDGRPVAAISAVPVEVERPGQRQGPVGGGDPIAFLRDLRERNPEAVRRAVDTIRDLRDEGH